MYYACHVLSSDPDCLLVRQKPKMTENCHQRAKTIPPGKLIDTRYRRLSTRLRMGLAQRQSKLLEAFKKIIKANGNRKAPPPPVVDLFHDVHQRNVSS